MNFKLPSVADNATSMLDATVSASALTIPLASGTGIRFPVTRRGTATSVGTATTLTATGIGSFGIAIGDFVENVTDGSHAWVTAVSTNALTTTALMGGSSNTWGNGHIYATGRSVVTLGKKNVSGVWTSLEQVLVGTHAAGSDILTVESGGRGYAGTTAAQWNAGDPVELLVTSALFGGLYAAVSELVQTKADMSAVTSLLSARNWKQKVVTATTTNITLSGTQTVDGVALAVGDRVLVKAQTTATQNGIYIVNAAAWLRATDFDEAAELAGSVIPVMKGSSTADTIWVCTADEPLTLGTASITFASIGASLTRVTTAEMQSEPATEDTHYATSAKVQDFYVQRKVTTAQVQSEPATEDTRYVTAAKAQDFYTQRKATTAQAQAGVEDTRYVTSAKVKDAITAQVVKATTAEAKAEPAIEDVHYMTPAKTQDFYDQRAADQGQAEGGTDAWHYMTPFRTKQSMNLRLTAGENVTVSSAPVPVCLPVPRPCVALNYSNSNSTTAVTSTYRIGQTFTATNFNRVFGISLTIASTITGESVYLEIFATSGGLPTGSALASVSLTAASASFSGMTSFIFSSPVTLTEGSMYCFVLRRDSTNNGFSIYRQPSAYAGGSYVYSSDSGATWASTSSHTVSFKLFADLVSTNGAFRIARADAPGLIRAIGFVTGTTGLNASASVVRSGVLSGFSGLTIGRTYYLGLTGGMTDLPGTYKMRLGYAVSATQLCISLGFEGSSWDGAYQFSDPTANNPLGCIFPVPFDGSLLCSYSASYPASVYSDGTTNPGLTVFSSGNMTGTSAIPVKAGQYVKLSKTGGGFYISYYSAHAAA